MISTRMLKVFWRRKIPLFTVKQQHLRYAHLSDQNKYKGRVLLKKIILGSLFLLSAGYGAAVIISQNDPKFKKKFRELAPGADLLLSMFSEARDGFIKGKNYSSEFEKDISDPQKTEIYDDERKVFGGGNKAIEPPYTPQACERPGEDKSINDLNEENKDSQNEENDSEFNKSEQLKEDHEENTQFESKTDSDYNESNQNDELEINEVKKMEECSSADSSEGEVGSDTFEQVKSEESRKLNGLAEYEKELDFLTRQTETLNQEQDTLSCLSKSYELQTAEVVRTAVNRAVENAREKYENELEKMKALAQEDKERELAVMRLKYNEEIVYIQRHLKKLYEKYYKQKIEEEKAEVLQAAEAQCSANLQKERTEHLHVLNELRSAFEELEASLQKHVDATRRYSTSSAMHFVIYTIADSLEHGKPFEITKRALAEKFRYASPLLQTSLSCFPEELFRNEVSSFPELVKRFSQVQKEVRRACFLPEDGGGFGTYLLASLLTNLPLNAQLQLCRLLKSDGLSHATDTHNILEKAKQHLWHGQLYEATAEVNQLRGWPRLYAKKWLKDARVHLETKEVLTILKSEV
jgi:hypothetical protein